MCVLSLVQVLELTALFGKQVWFLFREEGGREEHGQERVTVPPFWLALASALGRKHLCPVDTRILCRALNVLPDLGRVASLSLSLSFHIWIMGNITHQPLWMVLRLHLDESHG